MIHIVSAHVDTDVWFKYQLRCFERHIHEEYRLYMALPALVKKDPDFDKVHFAITDSVAMHGPTIARLTDEAVEQSTELEDLLIIIDADAFPIGDIIPFVREQLKTVPLVAIQRIENLGEAHPHPSFFATTVGFWKRLPCTWDPALIHRYDGSKIFDPGGVTMERLIEAKMPWSKMWRTNKRSLHPIRFGVYADLIYHHGASFRLGEPILITSLAEQSKAWHDRFVELNLLGTRAFFQLYVERQCRAADQAAAVEKWIASDPTFYDWFLGSDKKAMPDVPPFCDHKNLHFKGRMYAGQTYVECLDCLSTGPIQKNQVLADLAFREAARHGTLHTVAWNDWTGRYNRP